jgi:hypothetical protein
MTAPVSVSCSKQTKSLSQTGLRSISGIGTDRRASDMFRVRPTLPDFWRRADFSLLIFGS